MNIKCDHEYLNLYEIISFVAGEEYIIDRRPADKEEDLILVEYLSGLTLKEGEEEELPLPGKTLPIGFHIKYKRSCRRTLFQYNKDFAIIVSKEISRTFDDRNKENVAIMVCRTLDNSYILPFSLFLNFITLLCRISIPLSSFQFLFYF